MGILDILGFSGEDHPARTRDRVDADVLAELHHHLDLATAELVATGVTPEEAALEARRRFGKLEPVRRRCLRTQLGDRTMLHKIHVAFTCVLAVAVMGFAVQNLMLHRRTTAAEEAARARMADLPYALLDAQRTAAPAEHVTIELGDRLVITDAFNPEQNVTKTVAEDGTVLVPNLGGVPVAGLTRSEAEALLTGKSSQFFLVTSITVEVIPLREAAAIKAFKSVLFSGF